MKKFLVKRQNNSIAHVFYQNEEPTAEQLIPFGDIRSLVIVEERLTQEEADSIILDERRRSYPTSEELLEAIFEKEIGNPIPMQQLVQRVTEVRDRVPRINVPVRVESGNGGIK